MKSKQVKGQKNDDNGLKNDISARRGVKDFLSRNYVPDKTYSIYEDRNKKKQVMNKSGINNIISNLVIMVSVIIITLNYKLPMLGIVLSGYSIISIAVSWWNICKGENKKIWITSLAISTLFTIAGIISFFAL